MILVIKHVANEGPGTIETFFKKEGFDLRTIELSSGGSLPDDFSGIEAVVSMGGPMNVYEEDKYPFLKDEDDFIKKVIRKNIPFLGVCLGSQLLAKAADAKVTKAPREEIGWFKVNLTADGLKDSLFKGVSQELDVFQWHGDTFAIPPQGKHLAASRDCANQALKVGRNAYGLQFHIEVTEDIIRDWVESNLGSCPAKLKHEYQNMIDQYSKMKDRFNQQANIIYKNFLRIMSAQKTAA